MARRWIALLCVLMLHTHLHADPAQHAWTAAGADAATTAAALATGMVGLPTLGAVAFKAAVMGYIQGLPEEEQTQAYHLASSTWAGAAANNLCWIAGAGPVCLLLGALTSRWFWRAGEPARQEALARHRLTDAQTASGESPPADEPALAVPAQPSDAIELAHEQPWHP